MSQLNLKTFRNLFEYGLCFGIYKLGHSRHHIGHKIPEFIHTNSSQAWFSQQFSVFGRKYLPKFAEIRTERGLGFAFNMIDAEELLNFDE